MIFNLELCTLVVGYITIKRDSLLPSNRIICVCHLTCDLPVHVLPWHWPQILTRWQALAIGMWTSMVFARSELEVLKIIAWFGLTSHLHSLWNSYPRQGPLCKPGAGNEKKERHAELLSCWAAEPSQAMLHQTELRLIHSPHAMRARNKYVLSKLTEILGLFIIIAKLKVQT